MSATLNMWVIVIYLVSMLALGLFGARRAKNQDDYRLAGRSLGMGMYVSTMSAVVIGGSATVGGVALGYQYGISGFWMVTAIAIGLLLLSLFIAGPMRRVRVYTVNQVLHLRYGREAVARTSSVVTVLYTMALAINSTSVYATIFAVLFPGLGGVKSVLLGGAIVVLYSVFGGMWSITLTDMMQFIFMTLGMFFILLPFSLYHAGGISGLVSALPDTFFSVSGIGTGMIITYLVIFVFGMLIGQDIWQRMFTSASPEIAKKGGVLSAIYVILYSLAGAVIGMCGRVIIPDVDKDHYGDVFAMLAQGYVPTILGGVVLAAGVAAMMSTASGTLIAAATVMRVDLAPIFVKSMKTNEDDDGASIAIGNDRIFVFVLGIIATGLAMTLHDPVMGMVIAYDILVGGLFIPIVGALAWKRANGTGAMASMIVGAIAVIVAMFVYGPLANEPIYWGLACSLVAFIVGSLLTKPTDPKLLAIWEKRVKGLGPDGQPLKMKHHDVPMV